MCNHYETTIQKFFNFIRTIVIDDEPIDDKNDEMILNIKQKMFLRSESE